MKKFNVISKFIVAITFYATSISSLNSDNCGVEQSLNLNHGLHRQKTQQPCPDRYYGICCNNECGSCLLGSCDPVSGHCPDAKCSMEYLARPLCQVIEAPLVTNLQIIHVTNTSVQLYWDITPPNVSGFQYNIAIEMIEMLGCKDYVGTSPLHNNYSKIETRRIAAIRDLHPYTSYKAVVYAYNSTNPTNSSPKSVEFETSASDIPTSKISNFKYDFETSLLTWEKPKDCRTITGPITYVKLLFTPVDNASIFTEKLVEQNIRNSVNISNLGLIPNTKYRVRAYLMRNNEKSTNLAEFEVTEFVTRKTVSASSKVENLNITYCDPDANIIHLNWDPPNRTDDEIDSYELAIFKDNELWEDKILKIPKIRNECRVKLPLNLKNHNVEIKFYTKIKSLTNSEAPVVIQFDPFKCFKVPGQPLNLTARPQTHGIVILTWAHPLNSYISIKQFNIKIVTLSSNLLEFKIPKVPSFVNHTVSTEEQIYTRQLYLQTSTSYKIFVTALNVNNLESSAADIDFLSPEGFSFEDQSLLQIKRNQTFLDIKIPMVTNVTSNTNCDIFVKGYRKCSTSQKSESGKWTVATYQVKTNESTNVIINSNYDKEKNCFLQFDDNYEIIVVARSISGMSNNSVSISLMVKNGEKINLIWLIIFPILIMIVSVTLICIWCRKRDKSNLSVTYTDVIKSSQIGGTYETLKNSYVRQSLSPPLSPVYDKTINRLSSHYYAEPFFEKSKAVDVKYFEEYVKSAAFNGDLYSKYSAIVNGVVKSCDYGRLPKNVSKNRDMNMIPYDETRVILDGMPGAPYSDYINANYIQGYGASKTYIAAQGPKSNTIDDFWRMIWQEGVSVICMLTNVMENNVKMCEQYWPDVGEEYQSVDLTISNEDHKVFADYTFRIFKLTKNRETREVNHLHYTGWPELGITMYSQSLVTYLKKLAELSDGNKPVVVHCSLGDGRTGTIILCDICIRQGIVEGKIDVQNMLERINENRANMVGNAQQYLLAHVIIIDSIMYIPSQIPCDRLFLKTMKTLRKQLPWHMKRLEDSTWQDRAFNLFTNNLLSEMNVKSTNNTIENDFYGKIDKKNNYIDALSIDGLKIKNQYLASKLDSSSVLPNFWKFVAERNIELVIILQKPDSPNDSIICDFMPGDSILVPLPYIQIETKSSVNQGNLFTIDKLSLIDTSENIPRQQSVTVLTCNGWEYGKKNKPPSVKTLISLWQSSESIRRNEEVTLVLCRDGVTACGLYLALSFLLERMAVDRECDVISAVRAVRRSNIEFVQSQEQFEYLYDAAINYVQSFETYGNFS